MKTIMAFAVALVALCQAEDPEALEPYSDVHIATKANFTELIQGEVVMTKFYAPWCKHCQELAPHWEQAAIKLKGKVTLLELDVSLDKDFSSGLGITQLPTIKVYRHGNFQVEYKGEREADDIVRFAERLLLPAAVPVEDKKALDALSQSEGFDTLTVGFFADADGADAKGFAAFAEKHRFAFFGNYAIVTNAELAAAEGVEVPSVVVYKRFDGEKAVSKGWKSGKDAAAFVRKHAMPVFGEVGPENYDNYIEVGRPMGWLFVDPDDKTTPAVKAAVLKAAKANFGAISMVWLNGTQFPQNAGNAGLSGKKWPAFGIHDSGDKYAYDEEKDILADEFQTFVADFVAGKLSPTLKTESIPKEPKDKGVTVVVGKTFKDIVLDPTKDVFINFYAPWCNMCTGMMPEWEKLAKIFEDHPTIVIAKMDATANDVPPGWEPTQYPTLKLVYQGTNEALEYGYGHVDFAMEKWIREWAPSLAEERKKKKKNKKKKAAEKDDNVEL